MTSPPQHFDVTVVVPAYQSERWITATLAAIRAQTLAPREIIVIDNGSNDATAALAEDAGATVLRLPSNGGPSAARNAGILHARTEWIAFCDADDLWEPSKLARHAEAAARCPEVSLTFSDWVSFDENGVLNDLTLSNDRFYQRVRRVSAGAGIYRCDSASLAEQFYKSMFILTSAMVVRRQALIGAGLFDEGLRIAEDYDLCLRMLARGSAAALEEPLVRYRRHAASISSDTIVNSDQHRLLRERIAAAPWRYPAGAERFVREDRVRQTRAAAEYAVRVGRLRDARAFLRQALQMRPSLDSAFLYFVALAGDNRLGHRVHALARSRWRSRKSRYLGVGGGQDQKPRDCATPGSRCR